MNKEDVVDGPKSNKYAGQQREGDEGQVDATNDLPASESDSRQMIGVADRRMGTSSALEDGVRMGIDIVDIAKMRRVMDRSLRFCVRVFTEEERAYCDRANQPAVHYAMRFAAKQAVLKSLGKNSLSGISLRDIEISKTSKGRSVVKLRGKAQEFADGLGIVNMPISLSFTHSEAVGCVMAITVESVSASQRRVDPTKELSVRFKQARAMLDDLPATDLGENYKIANSRSSVGLSSAEGFTESEDCRTEAKPSDHFGGLFDGVE